MADQPDHSGSCMLALYPPPEAAQALALPGGMDPADLHVTVAYCGKAADVDQARLLAAARSIKAAPFTAQISGSARFTGNPKGDVLVALVDAAELEDLRAAALVALKAQGVAVPREHGYCAHASRAYIPPHEPDPTGRLAPFEVAFTHLSVVHGDQRTDIPLAATAPAPAGPDDLTAAVKESYAQGWARSGGPMTDRVRQGCAAAVQMAHDHPDRPGLLEVTLHLGHLEGAWATVYQRRENLITRHAESATRAWKQVLTRDLLAGAVSDFRRRAGLLESDTPDQGRDQELATAAVAAAAAMLQALRSRPEWRALAQAIRKALTAGRAEGIVAAVAIAAEQVHKTGLDWDLAFEHAYRGLENLDAIWADADGWLGRILERATLDLGRALANAARSGATYAQTLADAMDALDSEDVDAVSFVVDWAMTEALRRGAIDLYASEGVVAVDWLTAGDTRVCIQCDDNEANSPYSPADYPALPHPRCRCSPSASVDLSNYAAWFAD